MKLPKTGEALQVNNRRSERGYITVPELAARMKLSLPSAYSLVHSKGFPLLRAGRCLRIPTDRLEAWEEEHTNDKGF